MTLVLVASGLAILLAVVVLAFLGTRKPPLEASSGPSEPSRSPCPLCGSPLAAGERVASVVYASSTDDKIMEISGCPHCRPPGTVPRFCPVCKKALRPQDVVTARVFERKNATGARKTHVHVLGCPRCRA